MQQGRIRRDDGPALTATVDRSGSGMVVTLANVMLRQAEKTNNARQYLDDLIAAKFGDLNTQNGQIVATTVNGKSMTLQTPAGATLPQIMAAAELALSCLEAGLYRCPRQTYAVLR